MKAGEAAYLARRGREGPTPTLLHVTNGESAGTTLRQTTLAGAVLCWQDTLHEGPVPAGSRAELRRVRARFLSECGCGSRRAIVSTLERRDRQLTDAVRAGAHVVLWFEHDLYDQLQLIDALSLVHDESVELIVVDSFLGERTADELEVLWPQRRAATRETLRSAAQAWDAFRASDPRDLAHLATQDSPELPFLAPALARLLAELPAPGDGLSATERHALQAIDAGAQTPMTAFVAAQKLEAAKFLGDTWFYRSLAGLGPLVETTDGEPLPKPPPLGDVEVFMRLPIRLTREGERVLAGDVDRVELVGVDRWLGGTHVTPQNLWRWNAGTRELESRSAAL
jgi:hypothetical protein